MFLGGVFLLNVFFSVNTFCTIWQVSEATWHICIWEHVSATDKRWRWLKRLVRMKERWVRTGGSYILESLSHGWASTHQGIAGNLWPLPVSAPRLPLVPVGMRVSYWFLLLWLLSKFKKEMKMTSYVSLAATLWLPVCRKALWTGTKPLNIINSK